MLNPPPSDTALAAPPAELSIRLLGLPAVAQRQSRLDIPRREVRALLYRLANRLEPVSREQLCFLFWPNAPEITARRALSHLLTHLRNALLSPDAVTTRDDQVELNRHGAWTDTTAVQVYTVHDLHSYMAGEIVSRGAARAGLTWHFNRPPVIGLDYEMDCRSVAVERAV